MNKKRNIFIIFMMVILIIIPFQVKTTQAAPLQSVTASDLINLINGWRTANGYPALVEDSILNATAYDTAVYMAVNGMRSHMGNVSGRIASYGYGGGAQVFATENFAVGPVPIEKIAEWWSDESHMYPATNPNYTDIGAGVYAYGDRVWYIIHAVYTSASAQHTPNSNTPNPTQLLNIGTSTPYVSQLIIPVQTVMPDENGAVIHEVLPGQALWSIAIAYNTKIEDLVRLNNLNPSDPTVYIGQKILVFEAVRTPVIPTGSPTIDPSKGSPTTTATLKPTKTKTATPKPTFTKINPTPTTTPTEVKKQNVVLSGIFQNKLVGVILISFLALGILLIVTGSFGKTPAPPDHQEEDK
jgi:uncharacterized protein YkwD